MTIEITLLPDGSNELPRELVDDGIVATYLDGVDVPPQAPIDSWRAIERETFGDNSRMVLRVRGVSLSDVPDGLLVASYQAITEHVAGVKPHPDGWHDVEA